MPLAAEGRHPAAPQAPGPKALGGLGGERSVPPQALPKSVEVILNLIIEVSLMHCFFKHRD